MSLSVALHSLAAIIWVGGMFFAYVILRPSAGELAGPDRLKLWMRVFDRFFPWVIGAIAVFLATGYYMLFAGFGGFGGAGVHVHVMHLTGWIMFLIFLHLYFAPWRRFKTAVRGGDFGLAGTQLNQIRLIVGINLLLGLLTSAIGASGRYWS